MCKNYLSKGQYIGIRNLIHFGYPRKQVCKKSGIGRGKYYRVRNSKNYEDYLHLVHKETLLRAARREAQSSRDQLEKTMSGSEYDSELDRVHGGSIIICALVGLLIAAIVYTSIQLSTVFSLMEGL